MTSAIKTLASRRDVRCPIFRYYRASTALRL